MHKGVYLCTYIISRYTHTSHASDVHTLHTESSFFEQRYWKWASTVTSCTECCCSWGTTQESSRLGNCSHIFKDNKQPKIILKPSVEVTRCSLWSSPFSLCKSSLQNWSLNLFSAFSFIPFQANQFTAIQTLPVLDMKVPAVHSTPSAMHSVPLPHKTHPSLQFPAVLLPTHSLHDHSQQNQLHPACLGRP